MVNADHEANLQPTAARKKAIRVLAGISEEGLTQFVQRVLSGVKNVDQLRQVCVPHACRVYDSESMRAVRVLLLSSILQMCTCRFHTLSTAPLVAAEIWPPALRLARRLP